MKEVAIKSAQAPIGCSSAKLAKMIYNADLPEEYLKHLPAQSLFLVIKHNGLASSCDLIEMATIEQCRLLLDFDWWERDQVAEDRIWEWLTVCDEDQSLRTLKKLIGFIDLKLVALLISKYVSHQILEEPTDSPPEADYHTPDKGYTWIKVTAPDSDKNFLLNRLLALIFESDADLFYQLLAIPQIATRSVLVEEAFQEKSKRLAAEGIPEPDFAHLINSPLSIESILSDLQSAAPSIEVVNDIQAIEPLIYPGPLLQPLTSLLQNVEREKAEAELTLIVNAAIVYWIPSFSDYQQVIDLTVKVKGALNIGLESLLQSAQRPPADIYRINGLQKLYRLGLGRILQLGRIARSLNNAQLEAVLPESELFSVIAGLRERFPEMPNFFGPDGTLEMSEDGKLIKGFRAIEHLTEIAELEKFLKKALEQIQL